MSDDFRTFLIFFFTLTAGALPSSGWAVLGGTVDWDDRYASVHTYDVDLGSRQRGDCSGVAVAADLMLTARHCLDGENGQMVRPEAIRIRGIERSPAEVFGHRRYRPHPSREWVWDIAALWFDRPVFQEFVKMLISHPPRGAEVTMVGFGFSVAPTFLGLGPDGQGRVTHRQSERERRVRRFGVDQLSEALMSPQRLTTASMSDLLAGRRAAVRPGDSGGGLFWEGDLVGIAVQERLISSVGGAPIGAHSMFVMFGYGEIIRFLRDLPSSIISTDIEPNEGGESADRPSRSASRLMPSVELARPY